MEKVVSSINSLPQKSRIAFRLKLEGFSIKKIGIFLGVKDNKAKDYIKDARKKLRNSLQSYITQ